MSHFFIDGSEVKLGGKLYFGWAVTGFVEGKYNDLELLTIK